MVVIRVTEVGTVEDQWQWLAREQNFDKVAYQQGDNPGSTVYYTNEYVDDYDWRYKGIYFQVFGYQAYAGYINWGDMVGTEYEYFKDVVITEDIAEELYEYLVYKPGW